MITNVTYSKEVKSYTSVLEWGQLQNTGPLSTVKRSPVFCSLVLECQLCLFYQPPPVLDIKMSVIQIPDAVLVEKRFPLKIRLRNTW